MYNRWRKIYPILDEHAGFHEESEREQAKGIEANELRDYYTKFLTFLFQFSSFATRVKNENQFWTFQRSSLTDFVSTNLFQSIFYLAGLALNTKMMRRKIIHGIFWKLKLFISMTLLMSYQCLKTDFPHNFSNFCKTFCHFNHVIAVT